MDDHTPTTLVASGRDSRTCVWSLSVSSPFFLSATVHSPSQSHRSADPCAWGEAGSVGRALSTALSVTQVYPWTRLPAPPASLSHRHRRSARGLGNIFPGWGHGKRRWGSEPWTQGESWGWGNTEDSHQMLSGETSRFSQESRANPRSEG